MYIFQILILYVLIISIHTNSLTSLFQNDKGLLLILFSAVLYFTCIAIKEKEYHFTQKKIIFLCVVLVFNVLNTYFIHSNLLGGASFILAIFIVLSLFLNLKYSNSLLWCTLLCLLRLPIKDYFQIIIGVPLRLLSVEVLEKIFQFFNPDAISQYSILIFENNITNIDYPCSGVSTIYYTLIFILLICFFKKIKFNLFILLKIIVTCILAALLNTFRIFILLLMFFQNNFINDSIHTMLGVINYIIVCLFFIFLLKDEQSKYKQVNEKKCSYKIIIILCLVLSLPVLFHKESAEKNTSFKIVKNERYQNLEFSAIEKSLYSKYGAEVEKYYDGENIIIKIKSSNFKTFHNPELCLKNQNFKIKSSKILLEEKNTIRVLTTDRGIVYYYFTDGKIITDDYYKMMFYSIFSKNKLWKSVLIYSEKNKKVEDVLNL